MNQKAEENNLKISLEIKKAGSFKNKTATKLTVLFTEFLTMKEMKVKCKYENGDWKYLGVLYTCWITITSASITEPNQEIKDIIGQHKADKTDRDVEAIKFHNTKVHYMPRGLSKIFPNLRAIWIHHCGLKEITREDLIEFENIALLCLGNNELTSLPDDLLEGMKKLKWISFSNNQLKLVSSQLLRPVLGNQLTWVGFRKNPTINAAFHASRVNPSGCSVDLPGLMKLIDEKCKKPPKVDNQIEPSTSGESLETFKVKLLRGLKDFWTSGKFSDFTIIVGERKFPVHKTVLAMQSKFFADAFKAEDSAIAELNGDEFNDETAESVLNWMYTGQIPDPKNAAEIFAIAIKFEISDLKTIAEALAVKNVNEDNAMEIFKLGHRHNSEKMKKTAFEVIKELLDAPELDDDLINEPEKVEKLAEAKRNYEEIKKSCKKRKLDDM